MLALGFTKKIETINKILAIIDSSNINELNNELISSEEKHFSLIEKYFNEIKSNKENGNKNSVLEELNKISPLSNNFFKKYYRSMVRANANLEILLHSLAKEDIEMLSIDQLIAVCKQIEDYMFNIGDNDAFSVKNLHTLKDYLNSYLKISNNLNISKDVYSSLLLLKKIPEGYKDFEITFNTVDDGIEDFSSRLLAIKLLYEVMLRLNNLTESSDNRLIILKTEKEDIEYYKIAGLTNLISDMYYLIKEWAKEFISSNLADDKEVLKLNNMKNLETKIKSLVERNQINSITGEKYLDVIKKSLKNLQIEKCNSIELYSENIAISRGIKSSVAENAEPVIEQEVSKYQAMAPDKTFNEQVAISKENDTMKKIENSILLNSTSPPVDQKSAEAMLTKGITLMSLKRYSEAISFFDQAIEVKVNYAEAYNYKANAYIQSSRFSDAIKLTDKAISLKPDFKDAYLNKGTALFSIRKHEDALTQYKKTIEIDPNYAEGYFNLGSCYMMIDGKKPEAIDAFTKAIEISPNYAGAYYNRACAYASLKDIDNCIKDLDHAVKLDRNFKNMLKFDADFSTLQEYPKFKSLIS